MLLQYCGYDVAVTMTSGAPGADANLNVAYLQCYPVVFATSECCRGCGFDGAVLVTVAVGGLLVVCCLGYQGFWSMP